MPVIARFGGISVDVYYFDHPRPHVHCRFGGDEVVVEVTVGHPVNVVAGVIPAHRERQLLAWAAAHQMELERAWTDAHNGYPPLAVPWP